MKDETVYSWIFLSIATASQLESVKIKSIIDIADGINHALPTQNELNQSITWLIKQDLISKNDKKYKLTVKGKDAYIKAENGQTTYFSIWKKLEKKFANCID